MNNQPAIDPAHMPFTGMISPPADPSAPAVHGMMGGHGMVYVPGIGPIPVAPPVHPYGAPNALYGSYAPGPQMHSNQSTILVLDHMLQEFSCMAVKQCVTLLLHSHLPQQTCSRLLLQALLLPMHSPLLADHSHS